MHRMKSVFETTATAAVLLVALAVAWQRWAPKRRADPTPHAVHQTLDVTRAYATQGGGHKVLVEFTDSKCPFCAAFAKDELPTLTKDLINTHQITLLQMDFPIHGDRATAEAVGKEFHIQGTPTFLVGTIAEGTATLTQEFDGLTSARGLEKALSRIR